MSQKQKTPSDLVVTEEQVHDFKLPDNCLLKRYENIRVFKHVHGEPVYFVTIPSTQLSGVWEGLQRTKAKYASDDEVNKEGSWAGINSADHMREVVQGKDLKLVQQIKKERLKGNVEAQNSGSTDVLHHGTHIAGGNVIVPAVLANHPKCFFRTSISPKEAVTVWIDGFAVYYESQSSYQERLIKAVAAAQRIALTRPVKLLFAIAGNCPGSRHMVFSVEVKCFPPDWARLAFLSHTSFLRIFGLSMQGHVFNTRSPNWYKSSLSNYVHLGEHDLLFEEG